MNKLTETLGISFLAILIVAIAAQQQQTAYASIGGSEGSSSSSSGGGGSGEQQCSVIPSTDPDLKGWNIETCSDDGTQGRIITKGDPETGNNINEDN